MAVSAVIDTNVFVGALMRGDGINRSILEVCFLGDVEPLMGDALFYEYSDLVGRDYLFANSNLDAEERESFFGDFCSICRWVSVHYRWRPNLRDEADNHIIELAMAGNAGAVVTWNIKDFGRGDLVLPDVSVMAPPDFLKTLKAGGL